MINILLIATGLAMDAFGASVALGGSSENKTFTKGFFSSAMFGGFQAFMPMVGWQIGESLKFAIASIDHWIAFFLLLFVGLKMIIEFKGGNHSLKQKHIDHKLILALAVATSIDALIVGMGISLFGVPIVLAVIVIGIVTFLLSVLGVFLGTKYGGVFQNKAGVLGGFIVILIGTKILVEHLFF